MYRDICRRIGGEAGRRVLPWFGLVRLNSTQLDSVHFSQLADRALPRVHDAPFITKCNRSTDLARPEREPVRRFPTLRFDSASTATAATENNSPLLLHDYYDYYWHHQFPCSTYHYLLLLLLLDTTTTTMYYLLLLLLLCPVGIYYHVVSLSRVDTIIALIIAGIPNILHRPVTVTVIVTLLFRLRSALQSLSLCLYLSLITNKFIVITVQDVTSTNRISIPFGNGWKCEGKEANFPFRSPWYAVPFSLSTNFRRCRWHGATPLQ